MVRYKEACPVAKRIRVGKMLGSMADNSERFIPKSGIRSDKCGICNQ